MVSLLTMKGLETVFTSGRLLTVKREWLTKASMAARLFSFGQGLNWNLTIALRAD